MAPIRCHVGSESRRSCNTKAPSATLTIGLTTETVATEVTNWPVANDTCCR